MLGARRWRWRLRLRKQTLEADEQQFGVGASLVVRERERSATIDSQGPFGWPGAGSDDDQDFGVESVYRLVPTMQRYRNNLTALSQFYNVGVRPETCPEAAGLCVL